MKVYYAHPITLYGSSIETMDLVLLKKMGYEVLNPNSPESDAGYKKYGMLYFDHLIKSCDVLAFRAFECGDIPAGIAKEIHMATSMGMPVIELPSRINRRSLSVDQTRQALLENGRKLL